MKKMIIILTIISLLFSFNIVSHAESSENYEDLTTMNFYKKSNELDIHSIKMFCSYDYCDYLEGESIKEALDTFTKRYLRTIQDEEMKSTLAVKGIRITKIIFQN